eukprot:1156063-Pelagomonas_calceolata.AAC.2
MMMGWCARCAWGPAGPLLRPRVTWRATARSSTRNIAKAAVRSLAPTTPRKHASHPVKSQALSSFTPYMLSAEKQAAANKDLFCCNPLHALFKSSSMGVGHPACMLPCKPVVAATQSGHTWRLKGTMNVATTNCVSTHV